jgi:hypothetical protein
MNKLLTLPVLAVCFLTGCETEQEKKMYRFAHGHDETAEERQESMAQGARRHWEETGMKAPEEHRDSYYYR